MWRGRDVVDGPVQRDVDWQLRVRAVVGEELGVREVDGTALWESRISRGPAVALGELIVGTGRTGWG